MIKFDLILDIKFKIFISEIKVSSALMYQVSHSSKFSILLDIGLPKSA